VITAAPFDSFSDASIVVDKPARKSGYTANRLTCMRPIYEHIVKTHYPHLRPRNDHELLALGCGEYEEEDGDFYAWADENYESDLKTCGGGEEGRAKLERADLEELNAPADVVGVRFFALFLFHLY